MFVELGGFVGTPRLAAWPLLADKTKWTLRPDCAVGVLSAMLASFALFPLDSTRVFQPSEALLFFHVEFPLVVRLVETILHTVFVNEPTVAVSLMIDLPI